MAYKMKTKSSAKKRFKVTGTGKIKRTKAGKNHILTKKNRNRKRKLGKAGLVSVTHERLIQQCLPYNYK